MKTYVLNKDVNVHEILKNGNITNNYIEKGTEFVLATNNDIAYLQSKLKKLIPDDSIVVVFKANTDIIVAIKKEDLN